MGNGTGSAKTSIGSTQQSWINARGYDLGDDVLGKFSFSGYFYLLICGEPANVQQQQILDILLIAMSDPGLNSTHQAARIAYASNPAALRLAMASGFLASGPKPDEAVDTCVVFLKKLKQEIYEADHSAAHILRERLKVIKDEQGTVPGFTLEPTAHDELAPRILALAETVPTSPIYPVLVRQLHVELGRIFDMHGHMSLALAIAAVQLEFDLPPQLIRNLSLLSQAGTLLAHIAEEHVRPIAPTLLSAGDQAIEYDNEGA